MRCKACNCAPAVPRGRGMFARLFRLCAECGMRLCPGASTARYNELKALYSW